MSSFLGEVEIWVNFDNFVERYERPSSETVKQLFVNLDFEIEDFLDYLITINNRRILGLTKLGTIVTSQDHPLTIMRFSCYIQFESKPACEKFCHPSTAIFKLRENDSLQIAFHKRKRIDEKLQIWSLFTSKTEPLIFKDVELKLNIDGKEVIVSDDCDSIQTVIQVGSENVGAKLQPTAYNCLGRAIDDLDTFILDTSFKSRCLYLRKVEPGPPQYFHSFSILQAAKESPTTITKFSQEFEVYKNWLSLSMFESYSGSPIPVAQQFSERFVSLMKVYQYQPKVLDSLEYTYSSVFSQALDRFLFEDVGEGCVLHQPVLVEDSNHSNRPDSYIARLKGGVPSSPILVSDFKQDLHDYNVAYNESLGYFQSVVSVAQLYEPMLVMPCTPDKLSLFLCWPINEKEHATIKVCEVTTDNSTGLAKYFTTLKYAVSAVCNCKGSFNVEPQRNVVLKEVLYLPNVYKHDNLVYKLFDTFIGTKPNVELVKEILGENYLQGMKAEKLTNDGRFQLLQYQYIPGICTTDKTVTLGDFKPVAEALDQLHHANYVHSDVRLPNIVFTDGGNAKLIDFDLTDLVNTPYPNGYNFDFEERHPEAKKDRFRKIVHDRYSLYFIITNEVSLDDQQKSYFARQWNRDTELLSVIEYCCSFS